MGRDDEVFDIADRAPPADVLAGLRRLVDRAPETRALALVRTAGEAEAVAHPGLGRALSDLAVATDATASARPTHPSGHNLLDVDPVEDTGS